VNPCAALSKPSRLVTLIGVVLFLVPMCRLQAQEGFWYAGFQPVENPFQAPGEQYWVSPDGSDTDPGTQDQPWRTLTHARDSIQGGDVVNIEPGLYYFDGRFGPGGPNEDRKTVWRAADQSFQSGRVVITANEEFAPPRWSHADNVSLRGLWIGGDYAHAFKGDGGGSYTSRNSEIVNCTFFNGAGFAGGPAYNWLFQNNRMVHCGEGHFGHSMYMAGGARHDLPWNSRNLRVLGNIVIAGEGYAYHGWHSPVSITLAGNFSSGNYYSVVLQGPNHSCHHNVFWRPRGRVNQGDDGQFLSAWLPAVLRRFDHNVFGSPCPVWQDDMPPVRALSPIEDIYVLYDVPINGVPEGEMILLTGREWTGKVPVAKTRGEAAKLPDPGPVVVKPDFFPQVTEDIDGVVEQISRYFQTHDPRQISEDDPAELERLFDMLEVQYRTTPEDYACFPPMAQSKDDATYGVH